MHEKKRFSLLDVFIMMMILLGAIGMLLRLQILRADGAVDEVRRIECLVRSVPAEVADCLTVGETLYTADGTIFGILERVDAQPAEVRLPDNGRIMTAHDESLGRVDLHLSVSVSGEVSDGTFLRGGRSAILVGERISLYGERAALELLVCSVK